MPDMICSFTQLPEFYSNLARARASAKIKLRDSSNHPPPTPAAQITQSVLLWWRCELWVGPFSASSCHLQDHPSQSPAQGHCFGEVTQTLYQWPISLLRTESVSNDFPTSTVSSCIEHCQVEVTDEHVTFTAHAGSHAFQSESPVPKNPCSSASCTTMAKFVGETATSAEAPGDTGMGGGDAAGAL